MRRLKQLCAVAACLLTAAPALAHDPIFGLGPHVLFKNGVEVHAGTSFLEGGADVSEAALQLAYGITGDWSAGVKIPYVKITQTGRSERARGAVSLSTKYRFWRNDMPGAQESASVFAKIILDDSNGNLDVRDGNDYLLGVAYGYEARKWYRWGSVRRRFNRDAENGAMRPDIWLVDLVAGIRFIPTEYREPDWVWMIELNGEISRHATDFRGGKTIVLGGGQWFLSPGLMWTHRNLAIKTGVQLPLWDNLAGDLKPDSYRATLEIEWHL